jgi:hypothetical protein
MKGIALHAVQCNAIFQRIEIISFFSKHGYFYILDPIPLEAEKGSRNPKWMFRVVLTRLENKKYLSPLILMAI